MLEDFDSLVSIELLDHLLHLKAFETIISCMVHKSCCIEKRYKYSIQKQDVMKIDI